MSEGSSPDERQLRLGRLWKKYLRLSRGGVPALRVFAILEEEEVDAELKEVTSALGRAIEEGQNLSEAMQAHPGVFSPSALALVRAAEQHGEWDAALTELADGLLEGTFE